MCILSVHVLKNLWLLDSPSKSVSENSTNCTVLQSISKSSCNSLLVPIVEKQKSGSDRLLSMWL